MKNAACYVIDLDEARPEVKYLNDKDLSEDFRYYQTNSLDALSDNDRKYFKTEKEAESFLAKYLKVLKSLNNAKLCKDKNLPNLLYKRRYIVLSILGLKTYTMRHYNRGWTAGQLFNFYDQTYFWTVRLVSIEKISSKEYKYSFERIK